MNDKIFSAYSIINFNYESYTSIYVYDSISESFSKFG